MNRLQMAASWLLSKATGFELLSLTSPKGWRKLLGGGTHTGTIINDQTAMRVSTVWSCARVLSETVGALPMAVYERKGNDAVKVDDADLAMVLCDSPNADMTRVEFMESEILNLCMAGNAYAMKTFGKRGQVTSLYPIPAARCTPMRDRQTGEIVYKVIENGVPVEYPQSMIWHVKGFGDDGLVGYSPVGYMRNAFALAAATEEFGSRFFLQGARPSLVASIPQWLKEDQRTIARENITQKLGGMENAQGVALLEGGMTVSTVTMPLEDAQFLETRGFQRDEICGIYRVPPHMVANLDRATNNNVEQLSLDFVMYTLMPYLTRFEQSASKWLLRAPDRQKYFLRFNFEGLLRADSAGRAEFYSKMLQNGVYNRNEVRRLENMNSVAGLDEYTIQTNMAPVDKLAAIIAAQFAGRGQAPAAGDKSSIQIINNLAEQLGRDRLDPAAIRDPDLKAFAAALRKNAEDQDDRFADMAKAIGMLGELVASLKSDMHKPREIVFDKLGNPIGSKLVDKLH